MKLTPAKLKKKKFASLIVEGKNATQAYKEIAPKANDDTAQVEGSRFLSNPMVQEEIRERIAQINPENVLARIDRLAESGTNKDSVKLRALELLGQTQKASIFKDLQQTNVNILNVLDVDDLRKRLADKSLSTGKQVERTQ